MTIIIKLVAMLAIICFIVKFISARNIKSSLTVTEVANDQLLFEWGSSTKFRFLNYDCKPIFKEFLLKKTLLFSDTNISPKKIKDAYGKMELEIGMTLELHKQLKGIEYPIEELLGCATIKVILAYASTKNVSFEQATRVVVAALR
jgi:hypothetical protein